MKVWIYLCPIQALCHQERRTLLLCPIRFRPSIYFKISYILSQLSAICKFIPSAHMNNHRIFKMPFASVYPHYLEKVRKKGRSIEELHTVIEWLTGYDEKALAQVLEQKTDFEMFFSGAPLLHPNASKITGMICGHRIEAIEDDLMRKIRYLDKLVDELAKGRKMEKILRP
jgi:hypothetical protein